MVNTRGWRLVGAAICATALALAGCGGGDGDGDSAGNSESDGPLAQFFGWDDEDWSADREVSEEERQQHYEIQEYIVTCMQEAGFEYTPEAFWGDQEDIRNQQQGPWEEAWALREEDPEAFAKQYGYGATTIDYEDERGADEWDPADDPNYVYRESLSPAAQEEYDKALYGDWEEIEEGEVDPTAEPEPIDPAEVGGCQNEAYEEVYGWGDEEEQFEELWELWDELYQRIEDDPRMTEVKQAWSTCMADAGYPGLVDLYDGENQVYEKQSELYGWDEEPSVEEFDPDAPTPSPYEPIEPDPAALAELRDFELAIAWADFECKRDHDVERIEREVRFEFEEQFIEDNRAELERYRDQMNQRGQG